LDRQTRRKLSSIGRHTVLIVWLLLSIFPVYWMVATSLKPQEEWFTWPPIWFSLQPTLSNYAEVWFGITKGADAFLGQNPLIALKNSIIIAGSATLLSVAIGLLMAYGASRFNVLSERRLFQLLMLRMVPPIVIAVPLVIYYSTLKLLDSWPGMIIIYAITTIPYSVWMIKSFVDEVPEEMEQAAQLLGASKLRAFSSIVIPLIRSGVVATCMFVLILTWSEYLLALVMTAAQTQTLPIQLTKYEGGAEGRLYGFQAALSTGITIPLIIIGFLIHKHLVRGFTFGMIRRQ
jgi:multiple sugar transport system permease protein